MRSTSDSKAARVVRRTLTIGIPLVTIVYVAGLPLLQRWHTRWGVTDEEIRMPLPGDDLIPNGETFSNHAVTIQAPAERVWRWLVQIGQDRAGFYSYDILENLVGADIHNRFEIRPEWQQLEKGDFVRSVRKTWLGGRFSDVTGWYVADIERYRHLVLNNWGAFVLIPVDERTTRFIIRTRGTPQRGLVNLFGFLFGAQIHFVMERKMLLTLKALSEAEFRQQERGAGAAPDRTDSRSETA